MATSKDYDPILAGDIVQAADTKRKQTSFDATNSPQYLQRPPQPAAAAAPAPTGPVGRVSQQMSAQASRPIQNLADAYPTAIGDGKRAIYAGVGGNGEASFSDAPSSINTVGQNFTAPDVPQAQRMTSLADGWRSGAGQQPAVNQPRTLADLGTVRNMGDGIGTFSQAEPGDAALASTRFQRANDERQKYQDNQRLNLANARLAQDQNFTVVRDSSRRPSLSDALYDQGRQQNTQNLQGAVASAQGQIEAGRTGRAADQQQRQTQRLEDAFRTASGPNATPEQQAAYQRLLDPTGKDALTRQKTQAEIGKLNADADKARREASSTGVKLTETQSKDLNYYGRGNNANDRLEDQGSALTRSASGDRGALRGWVDASLRGIPFLGDTGVINTFISPERQQAEQSGREFVSSILRKDSGAAITNPEMETYGKTYLPQPGDSEEVLAQKHQARTTALQGIRDGLGTAEGMAAPLGRPDLRPNRAAAATSAPVRISTMDELARLPSGTTFIAPDGSIKRKP